MKKTLKIFLTTALALVSALCFMLGCGGNKFTKTTYTDWGDVVSNGGFIAETQNYLYFINGLPTSTDDNTFGVPVKGSLSVISKTDFRDGNLDKAQVVVPKLFAMGDFDSGVYIYGDYVYYGTPNTDKDSSGKIANSEMCFTKTKLTGEETEVLFTVKSLSTPFRIGEKDGAVIIAYYDSNAKTLNAFNCQTKTNTVIAKTDDKADESLKEYVFFENGANAVFAYTTTVYAEKYYEQKASQSGYQRTTEKYNKIYTYSFGDGEGKLALSGESETLTYTVKYTKGDLLFFCAVDKNGVDKCYGAKVNEINDKEKVKLVNDEERLKKENLIYGLEEIYINDTDNALVYKTTLTGSELTARKTVVKQSSVSSLAFVYGTDLYYYNASNVLYRVAMETEEAKPVQISEDSVSASWYAPEIINIEGVDYLFYNDNSSYGEDLIKFVKLTENEPVEEDEKLFLKGQQFLAVMDNMLKAELLSNEIASVTKNTEIDYTVTGDEIEFTLAKEKLAKYDATSEDIKKLVLDDTKARVENIRNAVKLGTLYFNLRNFEEYDTLEESAKETFKAKYNEAKDLRKTFMENGTYETVRSFLKNDLKYYFQEATKLLEK